MQCPEMLVESERERPSGFVLTSFTGIYGPGYVERRAERIKNAYGIDVPSSA